MFTAVDPRRVQMFADGRDEHRVILKGGVRAVAESREGCGDLVDRRDDTDSVVEPVLGNVHDGVPEASPGAARATGVAAWITT